MSADAVRATSWYHTIELPGRVVTPGFYDHRPLVKHLPMPRTLAGRRCLDVGTANGFWAFEMERRGASEVIAIDVDTPARRDWQGPPVAPDQRRTGRFLTPGTDGFRIAHEALGSDVKRRDLSVYEVSPETVGEFDFAFVGSLLVHLRDPVGALAALRRVLRGELLCLDAISLPLSLLLPRTPAATLWKLDESQWWTPNLSGLRRLVHAAGFEQLAAGPPCFQGFGRGAPRLPPRPPDAPWSHRLWLAARWLLLRRLGGPSAWVLARPTG
jgi:tRNA (mo5U34)-methyltransferase